MLFSDTALLLQPTVFHNSHASALTDVSLPWIDYNDWQVSESPRTTINCELPSVISLPNRPQLATTRMP
jgi:hypothetical protein